MVLTSYLLGTDALSCHPPPAAALAADCANLFLSSTHATLRLLWLVQVVHHVRQAAVGVDIVSRHAAGVWPSSDLRSEIVVLAAGAPGVVSAGCCMPLLEALGVPSRVLNLAEQWQPNSDAKQHLVDCCIQQSPAKRHIRRALWASLLLWEAWLVMQLAECQYCLQETTLGRPACCSRPRPSRSWQPALCACWSSPHSTCQLCCLCSS